MCVTKERRPLAVSCVLALFSLPSTNAIAWEKEVLCVIAGEFVTRNIFPSRVDKNSGVLSECTCVVQLHAVLISPHFLSDSSHFAHPSIVSII